MLILDVDGTLTNGKVYVDEKENYARSFSIKDGYAARKKLTPHAIVVGIISHSRQPYAIQARAKLMGISHCYVGDDPKEEVLARWCKTLDISFEQVGVLADDDNDMALFELCGVSACPADASRAVQSRADVVLSKAGGEDCFREWVELYILPALCWEE